MHPFDQRRARSDDGSGAGRPENPVQPQDPKTTVATYRARPGPLVSGKATVPIATQRAHARVQTGARRRRLRLVIFLLSAILIAGVSTVWILASTTVETLNRTIGTVFGTPGPRPFQTPGPDGRPAAVAFPDWGKEPVNILLLGLDYRPQEEDTRADTQIVVHIDPVARRATMLSIPRDLWVDVPGYEQGRINSAYQHGDHDKLPGGGPGLSMVTVEKNFGIPIHYYAQVDFTGFERIVDTIGGVNVDVQKPLADNEYPLSNSSYGTTRIYIPGGLQHMDGQTALRYARSRHADSDIGRNSRQQQVLLGIRQQGMNLGILAKLNDLMNQLSTAVKTDLSVTQVGSLAQLSREIGSANITTIVMDESMMTQTVLANGANVLLPNWDAIRPKVAQAFADPALAKESAIVMVENGTLTGGVGRKVRDLLVAKGFYVPDLSASPDQGKHPLTTITDYTGGTKPRTLAALQKALEIEPERVTQVETASAPRGKDGKSVDFLVVAGDDEIK